MDNVSASRARDPGSILAYSFGYFFRVFFFFFFCSRSAVLRPSVHMLPGTGWCGAGLPPFPTACWWLTHPAAITGAFFRSGHASDLKIGTPVATLTGNRHHRFVGLPRLLQQKTGQALGSTTFNVRPRMPSLKCHNNHLIGTILRPPRPISFSFENLNMVL